MPAPGVLLIVTVVLIVLALVFFLVATIVALKATTDGLDQTIASVVEIIEKSAPVNDVVVDINTNLDVAVGALEGLLVKKAGMVDAIGLVDGLYPGAGAVGFREHGTTKAPRISEVYTRGTLTLARLGREAPIAVLSPNGPALRNAAYGSASSRTLYPAERPKRSPVIGTDSPIQYEASDADSSAV